MHPKDNVILALSLALSAMGFLVFSLIWGFWFHAAFFALLMLGAAAYVVRFIWVAEMPKAFRRTGWGG